MLLTRSTTLPSRVLSPSVADIAPSTVCPIVACRAWACSVDQRAAGGAQNTFSARFSS